MIGLFSVPLGIVVAWAGIALLDSSIPPDSIPYFIHWTLDARSLVYTVAIALATGIVFGAAPALQATGTSLQESLERVDAAPLASAAPGCATGSWWRRSRWR